ncbi:MAG TPA: hypothetical protein VGK74_01895 [Symbiobacteriaceae bacterium]
MKLLARSATVAGFLLVMAPRIASANHLSGGENDQMGLYGGIALVVGFAGLLGLLGLVPARLRAAGRRWGKWLLAAGVVILAGGGYHVARLGSVEQALGGDAYGRMATQQIFGTLAVFGLFSGVAYWLSKRTGVLDMGEKVKYIIMDNGDPAERTASRTDRPGEHRLMLIPFAAMGVLALSLTSGVLYVVLHLAANPSHVPGPDEHQYHNHGQMPMPAGTP